MYLINIIPKGNFISGFATFVLFLIPLTVFQFIILLILWNTNDKNKHKLIFLTSINFLLLIINFYLLYRYDCITT